MNDNIFVVIYLDPNDMTIHLLPFDNRIAAEQCCYYHKQNGMKDCYIDESELYSEFIP